MRKESQHCQIHELIPLNIDHQCQDTTKKFKRLKEIKSKNDFLDWLRSLPFQIRYLAVKVQAPGLAQITRSTLKRLDSNYDIPDLKKYTQKNNKNILDSIVFSSDGRDFFDSICFDINLIEFPEKLYELLMYSGENIKKFNPIEDMEKNRKSIHQSCEEIKHLKSKDQLCHTLVRVLRHQVFFNTCHKQQIHINDQKNRKKELSFYWKTLSEQLKHSILYLKKQGLKELRTYLMNKNINISFQELQKQIGHLLKLDKNQFCNRIFKCKLKKSLTSLTQYHQLVYKAWKFDFEKSKKKKNRRPTYHSSVTKIQDIFFEKDQKNQKLNHKAKLDMLNQKQNSVDSFQTNQTQIYEQLDQSAIKKSFFKQSFLNEFIQKKIHNNLVEFSQFISKQANKFHKARVIAFERLKFIMDYYGIPIKIFGSCASGIAIKNSDIDVAIDSSILNYFYYCEDQNKVKFSLQWLSNVFESFRCMKNIKFIKNASIPIIKLAIDTSEAFQVDPTIFNYDVTPYIINLNRSHLTSTVEIDITIQTHSQNLKCNHLGINTTKRINKWMQEVKPLKFIAIIMKYFLNLQDLNNTYKEGINTYCLVVMFMAAIRHMKLQKEENIVIMLEKILKFYVYQFDEKTYGIDLRNKKQIFYKKIQRKNEDPTQFVKAELQVLDPQNDGKNMTKKCYKYSLIKNYFQNILKKGFFEQRKWIISGYLKDKKLSFANIQNQNNLKKESLIQIANSMQNPFIALLKYQQQKLENKIKTEFQKLNQSSLQTSQDLTQMLQGLCLLKTQSIMS